MCSFDPLPSASLRKKICAILIQRHCNNFVPNSHQGIVRSFFNSVATNTTVDEQARLIF